MNTPAVSPETQRIEPRLPIAPGRVLRDRFVLTRIIGIGSHYTVFCARDLEATAGSDRPAFVALKTPRPEHPNPMRAVERLQHELERVQALTHDGIAQVFELANDGDIWFQTMELLQGESLASIMRRQGAALPAYLVRRVLRGIGNALAYAHAAGVAHGDLEPANVFVGEGDRIKLLGFVPDADDAREPVQRTSATKLAYASPQVLDGEAPQIEDDVFSLACIAYEIETGRHPFQQRLATAARAEGLRPDSPEGLATEKVLALMSALSFERDARPRNIRSLAKTLAPDPQRVRKVALDPVQDAPLPTTDEERRWWWLAGACLVAMIAAVVLTRVMV